MDIDTSKTKSRTWAGRILKQMGWKVVGEFPDIKKSIIIFAPHTAHIDALYGKLGVTEVGIKFKFLSKKELFFFPMNLVMKKFGSIPVRGVKGQNAIFKVAEMMKENDELHIIISPEGWIRKVEKWNKGFYHMARKADVPIVVAYLDYAKKEVGIKGAIYDTEDYNSVVQKMNEMYKGVTGKVPENFVVQ
jgi:1-acyl-sn-glycerol-3-phosphate acyltransferase